MFRALRRCAGVKAAFGTVFAVWVSVASAQRPMNLNGYPNDQLGTMPGLNQNQNGIQYGNIPSVQDNHEQQEAQPVDSTKKERVRKPLESYFFNDSIRALKSFSWRTDLWKNDVHMAEVDTALNEFQVDYPALQHGVGAAYLGNLGAASVPLDYFARPDYRNFSFAQALDAYLFTPGRVRFFNVTKPFTHLSYFFSGQTKKLEESLWATHAQNISPTTGFNLDYRSRGTRGMYASQRTRDKNFSAAFSHTGKKYSVHAGYIYNMANLRENGGVMRDQDITDTVFELPELVEINLTSARNELKNNIFYLTQSYGFPLMKVTDEDFSIADFPVVFIGHSMEYNRFFKKYTDTKEGSGEFYENWYINATESRDSIFESLFSNKLFVQIQPWDRNGVIGVVNAGIGHDLHHYYQFRLDDYLSGRSKGVNRNSTYVYGSVEGKIKRYVDWDAGIVYHPFGYRSQDLSVNGSLALSAFIKGHPVTLRGGLSYELRSPGYWTENYFSNHFVWNNSFSKESETRISVTLEAPRFGVELGAYQSITRDKIYYDASMLPAQYGGSVSVSGLYAKKDFRLGGLHLNNRVLLQFSNAQEVVPVPLASVYLSYFYEFNIVKNVLRMQFGLDGRYHTEYYAFGYNPATMQFYNQREKKLGNYPFVDLFAAAKWKRMRILVKLQHLNEDLFGTRDYFTVLHYPLNKRMFKLGFSWTFYD